MLCYLVGYKQWIVYSTLLMGHACMKFSCKQMSYIERHVINVKISAEGLLQSGQDSRFYFSMFYIINLFLLIVYYYYCFTKVCTYISFIPK